jgi:undecaprenyl-diphosphatase
LNVTATDLFEALLLGVVEGLTEFIPVSSTGHLILFGDLLGFQGPPGQVFEIVIQTGSILAVLWIYRARFLATAVGLFRDASATRFATNLLIAFLPALVVGALAHDFIKAVLFNPLVVSISLIVGGLAILAIERMGLKPTVDDVDAFDWRLSLKIGMCQLAAMIPGVSRSGATIMGALLMGTGRRAATEFSFFLAVPTLLAASVFDAYQAWGTLSQDNLVLIAAGFLSAFVAGAVVVSKLLHFVGNHGFAPFAWYRIAAGFGMLAILFWR